MTARFLIAAGIASIALAAQPDFRKATWGMSQAQVLATETDKPVDISQSDGEVIVKYDPVKSGPLDGRLIYIFANDKLVRAKYLSNAKHKELNDFVADFNAIEPRLTEMHGKPATERAIWENDAFQQERLPYLEQDRALPSQILPSDPNVGLSVLLGYLKLYTQRDGAATKVAHSLSGAKGLITHQIEYRSKQLEVIEDKVLGQISTGGR